MDIRTHIAAIRDCLGMCPQHNVLFDKSVLTGLYKPTSGTAYVYGMDIRTHIAAIRDCLGMCPQHNVFFDKLTVAEQLKFYGGLKGNIEDKELNTEVDSMFADTGLNSKRDQLASDLSGGMKRELCIGIALIGESKLVILDEPTAGIDAHSRLSIWHVLLKHKQGRTMILSTHHMDEADVLADRIAIIGEGSLRTAGSSLFLKKRFGDGIHLNVLKNRGVGKSVNNTIETFISERSNERSELLENMGDELVFRLSIDMDAEDLKRFVMHHLIGVSMRC
ncbi:Retinal-specific ATP-binding cassette transporter [Toxocara canis]|uniref:Retinal-specific ATP-binding cassette transporter n=1 Tax=Toxocara canis TaxID=6265 RepID=A0A0B2UQ84_TOXCA|nr:Retinal-specific ATP-binding cassette transporter [Toxocara canis]